MVSSEDLSVSCMLTAANMSGCLSLTNFHYLNVICITWGTFAGAASSNGAAAQEIRLHADAQHGCFWAAGNDAIWKFLQGAPGCPKKEVTIPNISTSLLRSMSYFTFRTFEDLIYIYILYWNVCRQPKIQRFNSNLCATTNSFNVHLWFINVAPPLFAPK